MSSKVAMERLIEEVHGEQAVANAIKRDEEEEKINKHKEVLENNLVSIRSVLTSVV